MERPKAVVASAIAAIALTGTGVGLAANSGLFGRRSDNVGTLAPVPAQPAQVTLYLDPATGALSATPPTQVGPIVAPTPAPASETVPPSSHSSEGRDHEGGERDD